MEGIAEERCEACRVDSPHVTDDDIEELAPYVPDWDLINEDGIRKLLRVYGFSNFREALDFTNRVAEIAEEEGHHPRLITEWGRVGVCWWTHKIRDLHRNDYVMAAKTDRLYGSSLTS
jgi:4a-hydroxytetrahydrobiopterin dehydratase